MTKKLGVGMATNALKKGILDNLDFAKEMYEDLVKSMSALNN